MSKILGLDLGSGSIGWAVINYDYDPRLLEILDMGSRVVSIDGQTLSKFNTGQAITINASRTQKRTARKTLDRFQARKRKLMRVLDEMGMTPTDELMRSSQAEIWKLRADAVTKKLTPQEIGRVLLHISQKRGYNASKKDLAATDKQQQGYIADVRSNYQKLMDEGKTIGQYYYDLIKADPNYRIKGIVYPRQAYKLEFDKIIDCQEKFYPELFTKKNRLRLRDQILFFQRPLKSCKHLVNRCEFETRDLDVAGRTIVIGPKVAHKSNPLFQLNRIWQVVNNIELQNKRNPSERYPIDYKDREQMVRHMQNAESLKTSDIFAILFNKKKMANWAISDNVAKGIPGDKILLAIKKALGKKYVHLADLEISIDEKVDKETGEIKKVVSNEVINQPLYKLWHTLYSVADPAVLKNVLKKNFGIDDDDVLDALAAIDFSTQGYGSLSEKAIKRILPYLMEGMKYSEACEAAGIRHSDYLTSEENEARQLSESLATLKKGELRQPIVEKILNQLVLLVNDLMEKYGRFDEIHIELARELKQSREERNKKASDINKNEKENNARAERIATEYGLKPNRTRIQKLKLWEESSHLCMYCQQPVSAFEFLKGYDVEVEHVVPKSLLFDDSMSNKVCACRKCNHDKGNLTAYDFMATKGEDVLKAYCERVYALSDEKKISKKKRDHLLMTKDQIPTDFIDRQLRESQYISRKAMEMLKTVCRDVIATSGSVTDYVRHIWGWDNVLHELNFDRYAKADLVEEVEVNRNGTIKNEMRIKNWSKRCDHRHHAIDALAIACTTRSVIQQLNHLNTLKDKSFKPFIDQNVDHKERQNMLMQYVQSLPHFAFADVCTATDNILVSFKPGVKLVSTSKRYTYSGGKRKCMQKGIRVPRGPLHEETVYGQIMQYDKDGKLVPAIVVKYPLASIKSLKDAASIVDKHIREIVTERLKNPKDPKNPFEQPLYSDKSQTQQIKSVRCFTGINQTVVVKRNENGEPIGFAKPGANHHVAIYEDKDGNLSEHIATFYHCVDRSRRGIAPVIDDTAELWSNIIANKDDYDQSFLSQLPKDGLKLKYSMQRNEMFLLGMTDDEAHKAIEENDVKAIGEHLYKVIKLSSNDYNFGLHTQTQVVSSDFNKPDKRFLRITSIKALKKYNPIKIEIDRLGKIAVR